MYRQLLFTAAFVLCLSTLASPNECARYAHKCAEKPVKPSTRAVTADTESSTLVISKLLYI